MSQLIIGDIHGCFEELQDLLERAGLSADDEIIALGDTVDRGPDTPKVLHFFTSQANARSVMGNHERKHVRADRDEVQPALSQRISRRQIGEADYPRAIAWMAGLPCYIQLPEAILVHGMFEPGVPVHRQRDTVIVGTFSGQHYLESHYDRPWHELYDGELPVIVGHRNFTGSDKPFVRQDQRVYGLDTRCYAGGALTGLLLLAFRLVSVPSRGDHWSAVKAIHGDLQMRQRSSDRLTSKQRSRRLRLQQDESAQTPIAQEQTAHLQQLAPHAAAALYAHVLTVHQQLLASLRADDVFDSLDHREQGRRYSRRISDPRLAPFLHQARQGRLSVAGLQQRFRTPGELVALARELGLLDSR